LEDVLDPAANVVRPARRLERDLAAVEQDRSVRSADVEPADAAPERRLAATGLSDEREALAASTASCTWCRTSCCPYEAFSERTSITGAGS